MNKDTKKDNGYENENGKAYDYDYIIIGGGTAGALACYYLSQFTPYTTLLIEEKSEEFRFHSAKIIVGHAKQYLHRDLDENWGCEKNPEIFLRSVHSICDSSRNNEAVMYGNKEFGKPYGDVIDEQKFIRWHLSKAQNNGVDIKWNTRVEDISITPECAKISLMDSSNQDSPQYILTSKLVLLATGSSAADLQKKLGFSLPYELNQIIATFFGNPESIKKCFKTDYFYHLHPKISSRGPLQFTKGRDFFNIIMVSEKPHHEMVEIFLRLIKNYDYMKPLFREVKNPPSLFNPDSIVKTTIWKHPIDSFVQDRVLLLGETTGCVTECYYEGFLGNFVTAKIASEMIRNLKENGTTYSKCDLEEYDRKVRAELLNNFHDSQKASEGMFLSSKEAQFVIWDAFLSACNKHAQVRKNIWIAWQDPQLKNYDLSRDEYCGEKIFFSLPLVSRVKLTPMFLKLKFSK